LRALRLRALADSPTAFGSTLEREEQFPEDVWHERAAGGAAGIDRVTFVAEHEGRWVGLATCLTDEPDGPLLVGMFVDASERRRQVGRTLVEVVMSWVRARGDARLSLWVTSTNTPAISLYERCGFQATGASRPVGHTPSLTELHMTRSLR